MRSYLRRRQLSPAQGPAGIDGREAMRDSGCPICAEKFARTHRGRRLFQWQLIWKCGHIKRHGAKLRGITCKILSPFLTLFSSRHFGLRLRSRGQRSRYSDFRWRGDSFGMFMIQILGMAMRYFMVASESEDRLRSLLRPLGGREPTLRDRRRHNAAVGPRRVQAALVHFLWYRYLVSRGCNRK